MSRYELPPDRLQCECDCADCAERGVHWYHSEWPDSEHDWICRADPAAESRLAMLRASDEILSVEVQS